MKLLLELMSMEALTRIISNESNLNSLREAAARELAKRENQLFHRAPMARKLTPLDYGI